jgi:WD40 repeat protein/serine/threonine protein kinase
MGGAMADVKSIFGRALEIPTPAERAAYLDQACSGDARLRAEVESLLQAGEEAGGFFDRLKLPPAQTIDQPRLAEGPGTVIGPYKLFEQIGEGGMGLVFVAEQQHPVRRKVALKVIKPGMDTRQVIARFEAERQALALMDHPNIAKVMDGGETASGRPYFVMDLVKGVPITEFCDRNHLTPRQRLELFMQVCQAVQHAHQKGVIHRDLKPSNVMVGLYEGKPAPKIIDFGVAKAAGPKLTEKTLYTEFGQVVGTLEYMSPEQAQLDNLDIDTRSDIYALGVLLYELLTGTTPLDRKRLKESSLLEMLRTIREEEPPRPSTRLGTTVELPAIAANRGLEPKRLSGLVRGELDWIVMKCLEKERNRRYETANSLARDIERYLNGELVQACPPSVGYRLRKWARRHRPVLLAAAALVAVLVAVALGATVAAFREQRLKYEAEAKADALDHSLYYHRIALAEQRLVANQLGSVEELLDSCPPRLRGWEWHYLRRWYHAEPYTELPWTDQVNVAVAFSPDGRYLAVGGADNTRGTLRLWDAPTGKKVRTLHGHRSTVQAVAFSPDSRRLASGSRDGTVRLWDPATGRELQRYRADHLVTSVEFSPDGRLLLTAVMHPSGKGGQAQVREVAGGQAVLTLERQSRAAFSPDGRRIASSNPDGIITIWDAATGRELFTCPGRSSFVADLPWPMVFSPDGRLLASVQFDTTVTIWDMEAGQVAYTLSGHTQPPYCLAFSPDGRRFASAGMDRTVRIWDLDTDQEVLTLRGHTNPVQGLSFSPDGRRLVSTCKDRTVKIWDATPIDGPVGPLVCTFKGHSAMVGQAVFHPDGNRIASASVDGSVTVWDARTAHVVLNLPTQAVDAFSVACSPDGRLLASGGRDNVVTVWDATTGQERLRYQGHSSFIMRLAFGPNGKRLASLDGRGEIRIWEASNGKDLATLQCPGQGLALVWSRDGRFVAAGNASGLLKVWDGQSFQEVLSMRRAPGQTVRGLAFGREDRSLAICERSPNFSILDLATGQSVRTFAGHSDRVSALACSPDGRFLASAGEDGIIKIWDAATGRELRTLRGHSGLIFTLAYSPDGRLLASACADKTVKVWDTTVQPDVLHGPEARAAVQARFAKLLLRSDVLESLRTDAALNDEVREVAVQLAQEGDEDPVQLDKTAYDVMKEPGQDSASHRRALRWAEAACRLEPANGVFLNTLALVQYRLGNYQPARATLARAEPLNIARFDGPWPRDLALRALIEIRQDEAEPARATLQRLRGVLESTRWSDAVEAKQWQREAEALMENKKPSR